MCVCATMFLSVCLRLSFLSLFVTESFSLFFKDTLRECLPEDRNCLAYLPWISPIYFVTFVLMAQFVLVNVVVAVLMKHLEESNKVTRKAVEVYKSTHLAKYVRQCLLQNVVKTSTSVFAGG